jgi:hypothetical protein
VDPLVQRCLKGGVTVGPLVQPCMCVIFWIIFRGIGRYKALFYLHINTCRRIGGAKVKHHAFSLAKCFMDINARIASSATRT